jgi:2-polyprenyl-3-methyl-5-hydroxy-6-metoxy-1,4-benzoquinol methylase
MDRQALESEKRATVDRYGPWTATNIDLGDGVYTMDGARSGAQPRLVRFGQLISDFTGAPLASLRILDLACLEGEYAIEFARQGAEVVGIEGRKANIEKARFARDALGLRNLELFEDDVRNLSAAKYGTFDVVLCSGILYHLDAPDVAAFVEKLGEVCRRCAIVDTHVSSSGKETFAHGGRTYAGTRFIEHHERSSAEEREQSRWASLENLSSFWFTRPSLYNALTTAGFTSVCECHMPGLPGLGADRITLAAIKGKPYRPAVAAAAEYPRELPETQPLNFTYYARRFGRDIAMRLPHPVMRLIRRLFAG